MSLYIPALLGIKEGSIKKDTQSKARGPQLSWSFQLHASEINRGLKYVSIFCATRPARDGTVVVCVCRIVRQIALYINIDDKANTTI